MNILFIIPWIPYPLNSGGAQAFFNMVDEIRMRYKTSLLLSVHNQHEAECVEKLKAIWTNVDIIIYNHIPHKACDAMELPSEMPSATKRLCSVMVKIKNSLQRKIARRVGRYESNDIKKKATLYYRNSDLTPDFIEFVHNITSKGFDLIQIEFYEYLPLVYVLPKDTDTVFLHHEIRFIHNANELSVFNGVTANDKFGFEEEKGRELYALSKYKHIIVLTEVDKNILQPLLPDADIYVSPAITDATKKGKDTFVFRNAKDIAFIGNSNHFPNLEGMTWFCKDVVPILKDNGYKGNIYITGEWDNDSQRMLQQMCAEIVFTGFVDDIGEFLNGKISIVPIRIGSGMRMKILDSIAACAPIVTTTKGCEGLSMVNGEDCIIADGKEDFANAIMKLQTDVSVQKKLASNSLKKLASIMNAGDLLKRRIGFYEKMRKKQ